MAKGIRRGAVIVVSFTISLVLLAFAASSVNVAELGAAARGADPLC